VLLAAGTPWYDAPVFWGIPATVLALVSVYAAWRAIPPRRMLYDWRLDAVQLVRTDATAAVELEVRRNGEILRDPHVVQVKLASRGRADIGRDAFDGPVVLNVGVPILDVLNADSSAEHVPAPPVEIDGSTLRVGPSMLSKRHDLTYSLLIEGAPASKLTLDNRPRDVEVRDAALSTPLQPWKWLRPVLNILGGATAAVLFFVTHLWLVVFLAAIGFFVEWSFIKRRNTGSRARPPV
jgi:hypothetical protein